MRPAITDRPRFDRLVEDLEYPAATIGRLKLEGRASWSYALDSPARPLTPSELQHLLCELEPHLLTSTEGGRRRLARWRADERLPPMPRDALAEYIQEYLLYFGDPSLQAVMVRALTRAPLYVIDAILRDAVIIGVGLDSNAWTSGSRLVDREGRGRARLVVLGPASTERTCLHEVGHVWTAPFTEEGAQPNEAMTATGEHGLRAFAASEGWVDRIDAHVGREERLADALAFVWLARLV